MKRETLKSQSNSMPIIRIAPICNGKIYVIPQSSADKGTPKLDLPIKEQVAQAPSKSGKAAKRIQEKYHLHIHTDMHPRFSVKYKPFSDRQETVYLYILPLKEESEISFQEGKFISADEINANNSLFCENLQQEGELLGMAAELWNDYFQATT